MAIDMSKMNEKRDQLVEKMAGGGEYEFYQIKAGRQVIRILPPKGDKDVFWKEAVIHFNLPGGAAVACLKQFNKKCPICEEIAKLKKSKSKEDQTLSKKMRASNRVYMNLIDKEDKDKEDVPQVMNCGNSILKSILDVICDPEYGDITDFNNGFDITLTKTGKGLETEYSIVPKRKESKATKSLSEEELQEALPDLDALVVERTKEEVISILNGEDIAEGDEIDENNEDDDSIDKENSNDDDEIEAQIREEINKNKSKK